MQADLQIAMNELRRLNGPSNVLPESGTPSANILPLHPGLVERPVHTDFQPVEEYDGLSFDQMDRLFLDSLNARDLVEFHEITEGVGDTLAMVLFRTLVEVIEAHGGALPLEGEDEVLPFESIRPKYRKIFSDKDRFYRMPGMPLQQIGMTEMDLISNAAEFAGFVERVGGRLQLTAAYHELVSEAGPDAVYPKLMRSHLVDMEWYPADLVGDISIIQDSALFSLLLLHRYGHDVLPCYFYEDFMVDAFPDALHELSEVPEDGRLDVFTGFYSMYMLRFFAGFYGLVKLQDVDWEENTFDVVKTPLLDQVFKWKI